ncbi:MAG: menaquinone biosynthetic enzyme MqnA/MqnD family protein [Chthoniobacterales bacterium]
MPALDSLRLGCVKYLNALPLIHGWRGVVHFDHPSVLCRMLAAGELDVALVSSFEYLRHPIYSVVDKLAIASDGPVFSVILAHRDPIERLREVVIDPASETSNNLLHCLLGEVGVAPKFVREGEMSPERGLLLIGDQAIRFRQESAGNCQLFDLGAEWKTATGLPFVYALWMVRPDYPEKAAIGSALRSVAQDNLSNLDRLIENQPESRRAFCEFYFRECLRFSYGEKEKMGFQMFAELCAKHQLLSAVPPVPEIV